MAEERGIRPRREASRSTSRINSLENPQEPPQKRRRGQESSSVSPMQESEPERVQGRREEAGPRSAAAAQQVKSSPTQANGTKPLKRLHKKEPSAATEASAGRRDSQGEHKHEPATQATPAVSEATEQTSTTLDASLADALEPQRPWTREQCLAAASESVAKAQVAGQVKDRSRFKCWCGGIPFGLSLPYSSLASRSALAAALERAFSDEKLQLEGGKKLHAILLDAQGTVAVYPPDRPDESWQQLAPSITRVYTCQV
ncbi:hypothetical protein WJX73_003183 [Symbiochloris irregularis]|uniref:Uncharacterized protein n=1 Tax=Symbiochloris irregularis TaxID=706552 RepID=A0AAW1NQM3_9CHLO